MGEADSRRELGPEGNSPGRSPRRGQRVVPSPAAGWVVAFEEVARFQR